MPYVNSRGEIVDRKPWSPIAFFLGIFGFIGAFFSSMFHLDSNSSGGRNSRSSGGSWFSGFRGNGGGSSGGRGSNFGGGRNIRTLPSSGGAGAPPMGGCCGGSCG
ncbi:uncharacterized protein LOC141855577 [Brevipalpus obovatus]|uniref:uncharacterized protein LOC141855577 n=1 Tax=Brevipalpus obovatus TaxID=246614 RepID=UPI003D9E1AA2